MNDDKTNYISEAGRLLGMIDDTNLSKKDYLFFISMRAKVENLDFISQKQIFYLRDIKDKQLEN